MSREDNNVVVHVNVNVPTWEPRSILFRLPCKDELFAGVMAEFVERAFEEMDSAQWQRGYEAAAKKAKVKK